MNPNNENEQKKRMIRDSIFKALSDGQWHRLIELRDKINVDRLTLNDKTKLSSITLNKHLKQMVRTQLIDKEKAVINGKYAVLFKATPDVISFASYNQIRKEFSDNVDGMIEETKSPLFILDMIHQWSQLNFIRILKQIQINKKMAKDDLRYVEELYLWSYYEFFTKELIDASMKIIDKIDIDQLLVSQAKEQKIVWEMVLKRYDELMKTNKLEGSGIAPDSPL